MVEVGGGGGGDDGGGGGSKRRDEKQGNVSLPRHKAVADEISTRARGLAPSARVAKTVLSATSRACLSSRVKSWHVADDSRETRKGLF